MNISYPEKNGDSSDLKFGNIFGKYLISYFNTWHGGIHIEKIKEPLCAIADGRIIAYRFEEEYKELKSAKSKVTLDENGKEVENKSKEEKKLNYSNSFILIQHDVELRRNVVENKDTKQETTKEEKKYVTFYSLYNHLMPINEIQSLGSNSKLPNFMSKTITRVKPDIKDNWKYKVRGLNARVLNKNKTSVNFDDSGIKFVIPKGTTVRRAAENALLKEQGIKDEYPTKSSGTYVRVEATHKGITYDNVYISTKSTYVKTKGDSFTIITSSDEKNYIDEEKGEGARIRKGKSVSTEITAIISANSEVKVLEKPADDKGWFKIEGYEGYSHYSNFEITNSLDESKVTKNSIMACDIPVKAKDVIGYVGAMNNEVAKKYNASQIEVFMAEGAEDFLQNKFGAGNNENDKKYITLPKGTVIKKILEVETTLKNKLPVKVLQIQGIYAKVKIENEITRTIPVEGNIYTPDKTSSDGKMKGYNSKDGYHIINFEKVNSYFNGILIEGESKLLWKASPSSDKRTVKYTPPNAGKELWIEYENLDKAVEYETVKRRRTRFKTVYDAPKIKDFVTKSEYKKEEEEYEFKVLKSTGFFEEEVPKPTQDKIIGIVPKDLLVYKKVSGTDYYKIKKTPQVVADSNFNFNEVNKCFDNKLINDTAKLYWTPGVKVDKEGNPSSKGEYRKVKYEWKEHDKEVNTITERHKKAPRKAKAGDIVSLVRDVEKVYLAVPDSDSDAKEEIVVKDVVVNFRDAETVKLDENKYYKKVKCEYTHGNNEYFQKGWVEASSVKEEDYFSAYNWGKFGFKPLDGGSEFIYDIKDLRDKERTDSEFIKTLWKEIDFSGEGLIDYTELSLAYRIKETQQKIAKIVCKHKSEWSYTPDEIKSEVEKFYDYFITLANNQKKDQKVINGLKKLKEEKLEGLKEQVEKLMFWNEASRLTYSPDEETQKEETKTEQQTNSNLDFGTNQVQLQTQAPTVENKEPEVKKPERTFPSKEDVYHFHPIAFVNHMKLIFGSQSGECYCNKDFTVDFVKKIVKTITGKEEIWGGIAKPCPITDKSFETLTSELNQMFKKYGINECIQKISFLAQVGAETGLFRQSVEESGSATSSQSTYKGRGIIQLTGNKDSTGFYNSPGAYQQYADYIGDQSIISNPDKVAENIHYTIDSAGWYFSKHKKIPKWSKTTGQYAEVYKKKRTHFSKALGKTLNEASLLIKSDAKYFWLQSKVINGYGRNEYLTPNPNGWEHRLKYFNKLNAVFRFNTTCINNPNPYELKERASWMEIAYGELWTEEISGSKHNPRVLEYHASAGHTGSNISDDSKWAWCSSFVCWVFSQSKEYTGKITAKATDWKDWGKEDSKESPMYGSLAVIDWDANDNGAGHVGFVVNVDGDDVYLLGGNQTGGDKSTSGKVCVSRYNKSVIDYFRIPPNYNPEGKDYEYDNIKNTNLSFETLSSTR